MNTTVLLSVGIPTVYVVGGLLAARISYNYDMQEYVTASHKDTVRHRSEAAGWQSAITFLMWPMIAIVFAFYFPGRLIGKGLNRFVTGGFKKKRARYLEGKSPTVSRSS